MKLQRRVFVVGGANTTFLGKFHPDFVWKKHPDFGKRENPTLEQHLGEAVCQALADAGADAAAVDKAVVGNFVGECFANQGHLGSLLARVDEGFAYKPILRVEGACASGGLAVLTAVEALQAGHNVTLAAGVEVQTTVSAREGADFLARAAHYESERGIDDFTFPAMFARRAQAYKTATGATDEDFARVTVKAFSNANRNPKAHMRAVHMSLEQAATASSSNPHFLSNEALRPHLKVSDCSQVSDGASAVVLATEAGLARLGKRPDECVELLAYGHAVGPLGHVRDYTELDTTARAAREMYQDAGIGADEVDLAEVHDCFTVTELLMYEALDFVRRGQGAALIRDGATAIEGRIPANPGGGLVAFGHPVGATGVKQVIEIARQMLGRCGDYQLPELPRLGITANMGGDDRTAVCIALRKV